MKNLKFIDTKLLMFVSKSTVKSFCFKAFRFKGVLFYLFFVATVLQIVLNWNCELASKSPLRQKIGK